MIHLFRLQLGVSSAQEISVRCVVSKLNPAQPRWIHSLSFFRPDVPSACVNNVDLHLAVLGIRHKQFADLYGAVAVYNTQQLVLRQPLPDGMAAHAHLCRYDLTIHDGWFGTMEPRLGADPMHRLRFATTVVVS